MSVLVVTVRYHSVWLCTTLYYNSVLHTLYALQFFHVYVSLPYLVHKNRSYVEYHYIANLRKSTIGMLGSGQNTIRPWFPMLHQAPLTPRWTNHSFIQRRCLPTVHVHRMFTSNVPIRPLLMAIRGRTRVGFCWFWSWRSEARILLVEAIVATW